MAENGHQRVLICTVDTDVLLLAIFTFDNLQSFVEELWLDFGAGKNIKFYPVHDIYEELGKSKAIGLPLFHAFLLAATKYLFYQTSLRVMRVKFGSLMMR